MRSFALFCAVLATMSLLCLVSAQPSVAATPSRAELRRVVEPGGMVLSSVPSAANRAGCQPQRGDQVSVGGGVRNAGTLPGATMLDVRVLTGRCKGATGWIGQHRLSPDNAGK